MDDDEMCPCGCGPRATLHERGFKLADLPDEERLAALDQIEELLRHAEQDARHHDRGRFDEAYRLLDLLRRKATL